MSTKAPPSSLVRKLLLHQHPNQRITKEGIDAAGELIHQFIIEAWNRASFEAEFEHDQNVSDSDDSSGDDHEIGMRNGKRKRDDLDGISKKQKRIEIKPEHVMKIAAELFLDFA